MAAEDLPDHFKKMGPAALRTLIDSGGLAPAFSQDALAWLAEQEQQADRRQAEQIEITRSVSDATREAVAAANRASTLAKIALVVAVASAIAAIAGIWMR